MKRQITTGTLRFRHLRNRRCYPLHIYVWTKDLGPILNGYDWAKLTSATYQDIPRIARRLRAMAATDPNSEAPGIWRGLGCIRACVYDHETVTLFHHAPSRPVVIPSVRRGDLRRVADWLVALYGQVARASA